MASHGGNARPRQAKPVCKPAARAKRQKRHVICELSEVNESADESPPPPRKRTKGGPPEAVENNPEPVEPEQVEAFGYHDSDDKSDDVSAAWFA
jgi:hypothetical protein